VGAADGVKIGLARRDAGRIRAARCRSSTSRRAVAPDWGERHRPLMGRARSSVRGRGHVGSGCYGPGRVSGFNLVRSIKGFQNYPLSFSNSTEKELNQENG
jgi:hypothetical protein